MIKLSIILATVDSPNLTDYMPNCSYYTLYIGLINIPNLFILYVVDTDMCNVYDLGWFLDVLSKINPVDILNNLYII